MALTRIVGSKIVGGPIPSGGYWGSRPEHYTSFNISSFSSRQTQEVSPELTEIRPKWIKQTGTQIVIETQDGRTATFIDGQRVYGDPNIVLISGKAYSRNPSVNTPTSPPPTPTITVEDSELREQVKAGRELKEQGFTAKDILLSLHAQRGGIQDPLFNVRSPTSGEIAREIQRSKIPLGKVDPSSVRAMKVVELPSFEIKKTIKEKISTLTEGKGSSVADRIVAGMAFNTRDKTIFDTALFGTQAKGYYNRFTDKITVFNIPTGMKGGVLIYPMPSSSLLLHEGLHKGFARLDRKEKKVSFEEIFKDVEYLNKVRGSKDQKIEFLNIYEDLRKNYKYRPFSWKEEVLAKFAQTYPEEILNPTTKTGKIVSKSFKELEAGEKDISVVSTVKKSWGKADTWLREKVTYKVLPPTEKAFSGNTFYNPFPTNPILEKITKSKTGRLEYAYSRGQYEGIREKPLTAVASGVAFFVLPGVLKGSKYTLQVGSKVTGITALSAKFPKTSQYLYKMGAGAVKVGLPTLYSYDVYKRIESKGSSEAQAQELGSITTSEVVPMYFGVKLGQKALNTAVGVWRTRGLKFIPTAKPTDIPFTKGGEDIFMERFEGVKITKPSTWLQGLKGYEKGQFTRRLYRFVTPEVELGITPFPYDEPSTHYGWFTGKGLKKFPVPKMGELPIDVINKKGFGYSVSPQPWKTAEIAPTGQYYSGKGASIGFSGINQDLIANYELTPSVESKPILYAGYFEDVKINPAIKEIRVPALWNPKGKPAKTYIFSKAVDLALQVPLYKPEVEGVKFGVRQVIRRGFYFKYKGVRVPIEEQVFLDSVTSKESSVLKDLGGKITSSPQYSSLTYAKDKYLSSLSVGVNSIKNAITRFSSKKFVERPAPPTLYKVSNVSGRVPSSKSLIGSLFSSSGFPPRSLTRRGGSSIPLGSSPPLSSVPIFKIPKVSIPSSIKISPLSKSNTKLSRVTPYIPLASSFGSSFYSRFYITEYESHIPIKLPKINIKEVSHKMLSLPSRPLKYQPSLVGLYQKRKIKKKPKLLTGVEVRGIL